MHRVEGLADIGREIREARKSLGYSLRELADLIDSSATHLSQIESGKVTNPGVELLSRIAGALDIDFHVMKPRATPARKSLNQLVYGSPFSLAELARPTLMKRLMTELNAIFDDPTLSDRQKNEIADKVLSYASWLHTQASDDE